MGTDRREALSVTAVGSQAISLGIEPHRRHLEAQRPIPSVEAVKALSRVRLRLTFGRDSGHQATVQNSRKMSQHECTAPRARHLTTSARMRQTNPQVYHPARILRQFHHCPTSPTTNSNLFQKLCYLVSYMQYDPRASGLWFSNVQHSGTVPMSKK
jgi:hypothetical protein